MKNLSYEVVTPQRASTQYQDRAWWTIRNGMRQIGDLRETIFGTREMLRMDGAP
jgi:hypothetical protein